MNKLTIQIPSPLNQNLIDAYLDADTPFKIAVEYMDKTRILDLNDFDSSFQNAIKKVIDVATYGFEENALVFNIEKDGGVFSLENSYVRNIESTESGMDDMPNATPLMMRVEIPGFIQNQFCDVTIYYDEDFNPADINALDLIGVSLVGNGKTFTVSCLTECKVSFYVPGSSVDQYVIVYDKSNEVI